MNPKEAKTGQSVDVVKSTLINPALVENILEIPNLKTSLSIVDIGSGDASSSREVMQVLIERGISIENLALVDADTKIFPDLIKTVAIEPECAKNTQILEFKDRDILDAFMKLYEGKFDIGIAQMVLHQIPESQKESYLMYLAYRALKSDGELFIVDFHPKFIQYLVNHEPKKLNVRKIEDNCLEGTYNFDSGGSIDIYCRDIPCQLAMFLGLGFDLIKTVPINTVEISENKKRYELLAKEKIPMFYLMELRKNPKYFISSTKGLVKHLETHSQNRLLVTFSDDEEFIIPEFNNWSNVEPGSQLILHETHRPETKAQIVNYWIANDENVVGGQLIATSAN